MRGTLLLQCAAFSLYFNDRTKGKEAGDESGNFVFGGCQSGRFFAYGGGQAESKEASLAHFRESFVLLRPSRRQRGRLGGDVCISPQDKALALCDWHTVYSGGAGISFTMALSDILIPFIINCYNIMRHL